MNVSIEQCKLGSAPASYSNVYKNLLEFKLKAKVPGQYCIRRNVRLCTKGNRDGYGLW